VPSPHRGRVPERMFEERGGGPPSPAPPTRQASLCACLPQHASCNFSPSPALPGRPWPLRVQVHARRAHRQVHARRAHRQVHARRAHRQVHGDGQARNRQALWISGPA
jgi:hypothetical protein